MEIIPKEVGIVYSLKFLLVVTLLYLMTGADVPDFICCKSGLNLIFCRRAKE